MKFAAAGFIVPFFFVCNPALLFEGPWIEILRAVVTNSIGVVALVASMEGYFLRTATWFDAGARLCSRIAAINPNVIYGHHRLGCARSRALDADDEDATTSCGRRSQHVTRNQLMALTLIAATVVIGTLVCEQRAPTS